MNFEDALETAQTYAIDLIHGVSSCSEPKTGLVVLVYGGIDGDALPGVPVTVDDQGPEVTDEYGLARFNFDVEGTRNVHVERPDSAPELLIPDDAPVQVNLGTCHVYPVHMPAGVRPIITIQWDHDDRGVGDVEIDLLESGVPRTTTDGDGKATWDRYLLPLRYDIRAVFPEGLQYRLFNEDLDVDYIDLGNGPDHTLKIKRNLVTFHIQNVVGTTVSELLDARVKLLDPDQELATADKEGQAVAEFTIPVVRQDQAQTFEVTSLTPGAEDGVYEVVEVVST